VISDVDILIYAASRGLMVDPGLVHEALSMVDHKGIVEEERKRWSAVVWDGTTEVNGVSVEGWLQHGDGEHSRITRQHLTTGGVGYHLYKDGKLLAWQPHAPGVAGVVRMEPDPEHPMYWGNFAEAQIQELMVNDVKVRELESALQITVDLHRSRNVPIRPAWPSAVPPTPPQVNLVGYEGLRVNPRP